MIPICSSDNLPIIFMIPFFVSFFLAGGSVVSFILFPERHFIKMLYIVVCVFTIVTVYMIYFLSTSYTSCKFAKSILMSTISATITSVIMAFVYLIVGFVTIRRGYNKMYAGVLEQTRDTEDILDIGLPKMKNLVKVRGDDEESHWTDEKSLISV